MQNKWNLQKTSRNGNLNLSSFTSYNAISKAIKISLQKLKNFKTSAPIVLAPQKENQINLFHLREPPFSSFCDTWKSLLTLGHFLLYCISLSVQDFFSLNFNFMNFQFFVRKIYGIARLNCMFESWMLASLVDLISKRKNYSP